MAVHGHSALEDDLLGRAPRRDAGGGQDLLEALGAHRPALSTILRIFLFPFFPLLFSRSLLWKQLRLRRVRLDPVERVEVLGAREVFQVREAEVDEELPGRLVKEGCPDDFLAAGRRDELLVEERAQRGGRVHAAQLGDLGRGDGLAIRDDRKHLEARHRELVLSLQPEQVANGHVVLVARDEARAARDAVDAHAPSAGLTRLLERLERGLDLFLRNLGGLGEALDRRGLARREEERLEERDVRRHRYASSYPSSDV